jgi:hypothetical protein
MTTMGSQSIGKQLRLSRTNEHNHLTLRAIGCIVGAGLDTLVKCGLSLTPGIGGEPSVLQPDNTARGLGARDCSDDKGLTKYIGGAVNGSGRQDPRMP